ncbi:type II secretion system F family protein [Hyalangium sp.]|uniref:type II secretion system F family protein n=1 Tax=Hyalangium sp. TaxID=2028555 RepID=UPI002D58C0C7|nr:type II secretion system F family protein [Hyalangium sp.]HYI01224.1 type II secretion system F family protein [Hyalangium sp.]
MKPPAPAERSQERSQGSTPQRPTVRTAQSPHASSGARERVVRAWARHPLVAMARHRRRLTFFVGLHALLRAGVPLNIAFTELSRGADKDPFRRAVAQVGATIAQGAGLAEAMRRHPSWFEPQVVAALEAGEVSGTLEHALAGIIARQEELQKLRWRTLSLCLYPAYLLVAFLIGGALLEGAGAVRTSETLDALPLALAGSLIVRLLKVTVIGLTIFSVPLALAALGLEDRWARLRLRLPLLGSFYRRTQASRFCQVLGSSLEAGVEAARSLQLALEASGNAELQARTAPAIERLRDGANLTDVVEWLGVLEGESLRHLAIGERTGHLPPLLQQQARENSEAGMRVLQVLVFTAIAVLVVFLMVTSIARIFESQRDYFRRLEDLTEGTRPTPAPDPTSP